MSFDLQRVLESKRTLRQMLARRPVAQKLAMLDELRDRVRTIRDAAARQEAAALRESSPEYRTKRRPREAGGKRPDNSEE